MTPTGQRTLATRLARDDPARALPVARAIDAPWFRCQALSHVARYWPDRTYDRILAEAVRAADAQDDPYRRAAVSAWPIRAFLERGDADAARALLARSTATANAIAHGGSRSEALLLLFHAAKPFAPALWRPVFDAIVDAAEPSLSWRQGRALRHAARMAIGDDRASVEHARRRLSDARHVGALTTLLAEDRPDPMVARSFF